MKDKRMQTEETEVAEEEKYKEEQSEYEEIAGEEIVKSLWFISPALSVTRIMRHRVTEC